MTRKSAVIAVSLVALTLFYLSPAILQLRTSVIGDGGDNYQFLGFQYLANRLIASGDFALGWTNYWRYPVGIDFQRSADSMLFVVLGLGLYRVTGNPVL